MIAPNTRIALGQDLLRMMARIRAFENAAAEAYGAGNIPGVIHLSLGQEAVAAGVCAPLHTDDYVASTHRGHGHTLAKGADANAMMAELFGRATGSCGGKGGSMHIADFSVGMLGANGVVGAGIGLAVGAAQGARLLGRDSVGVCFFGDGALNRGPLLEGLNWAARFNLPVLFVCEDNGYAAFTAGRDTTAGPGPVARAEACGVRAMRVDGNDALAIHDAAADLVARARAGDGPGFLHLPTWRVSGHTIFDPAKYRHVDEGVAFADPLDLMRGQLAEWGADGIDAIVAGADTEMRAAAAAALAAPWPDPAAAYTDVQTAGSPAWR